MQVNAATGSNEQYRFTEFSTEYHADFGVVAVSEPASLALFCVDKTTAHFLSIEYFYIHDSAFNSKRYELNTSGESKTCAGAYLTPSFANHFLNKQ